MTGKVDPTIGRSAAIGGTVTPAQKTAHALRGTEPVADGDVREQTRARDKNLAETAAQTPAEFGAGELANLRASRDVGALRASLVDELMAANSGSIEAGNRALALAKALGDPVEIARAAAVLGYARSMSGEMRAGAHEIERALKQARGTGDQVLIADTLGKLGVSLHDLGNLARARKAYEEAVGAAVESGDALAISRALGNLGYELFDRGLPLEAARRFEAARRITRAIADRGWEGLWSAQVGLALEASARRAGDPAERAALLDGARTAAVDAMRLGETADDAWNRTLGALGVGRVSSANAPGVARRFFEEARSASKALDMLAFLPLAELGILDLSENRRDDAKASLSATEAAASKLLDGNPAAFLPRYFRAIARLGLGDAGRGIEDLKAALALCAPLGVLEDVGRMLSGIDRAAPSEAVTEALGLVGAALKKARGRLAREEKARETAAEEAPKVENAALDAFFAGVGSLSTQGRYREGLARVGADYFPNGLTAEPNTADPDLRYFAINEAAIDLVGARRFEDAQAMYGRNLETAIARGDLDGQRATHLNLAELHYHQKAPDEMARAAKEGLDLARLTESPDNVRDALILLATAESMRAAVPGAGREPREEAERRLAEVEMLVAEGKATPARDIWGVMLADLLRGNGRLDDARHLLAECRAQAIEDGAPQVQAVVLRALGDVEAASGKNELAGACFREAVEIADRTSAVHVQAEVKGALEKHRGSARA
jgi:tetratricopeptide repeat protein